MYTVTFYSFKGGVGRTMALANCAVHLASIGKRVLIVDFDLEAPGVDTVALGGSHATTPGIVEFVHEYLAGDVVPDVREFLTEIPGAGKKGGCLWVMPAGRVNADYSARLNAINWSELYRQHDGYVLFEDMKAQWNDALQPDYVLVDSRTGMTDVGGICTRQLPDAVVLLFMPNADNLRGIAHVASEIRAESESPQQKRITLHYVMSNVPYLDDEQRILVRREREFREALGLKEKPLFIYRYESLSLLDQSIFTKDRPLSRLAREYRALVARIRGANPEDPGGALEFLDRVARVTGPVESLVDIEDRLERILHRHSNNPEVLVSLARVRQQQGRAAESVRLLEIARSLSEMKPSAALQLAENWQLLGNSSGAANMARSVFDIRGANANELGRALEILRLTDSGLIAGIASSDAVFDLSEDGVVWLASNLAESREELIEARAILERVLRRSESAEVFDAQAGRSHSLHHGEIEIQALSAGKRLEAIESQMRLGSARHTLGLCYIGLGEFDLASELILDRQSSAAQLSTASLFNFAMSEWGRTGTANHEWFESVLSRINTDSSDNSANTHQCLALAYGVLGDSARARDELRRAREFMTRAATREFSCWRYLRLRPDAFMSDLSAMEDMLDGVVLPPVLSSQVQVQKSLD